MSYRITKNCISCEACQPLCPTNAIEKINGMFFIDSTLCNDCNGYYGTPQCAAVCPTNSGCLPDFYKNDYWQSWFKRYNHYIKQLKTRKKGQYWERWFDIYSTKRQSLVSESLL